MKRLLFTTILSTMALAGSAYAQTPPDMPEITAPEGFTLQNDLVTSDSLLGATIYDAAGDAIGSVGDLVFDLGTADGAMTDETMSGAAQTPDPAEAGTTQEGMNVDALDGATAEGLDGEAGEQVVPGTNDAVNGVGGGTEADPATNADAASTAMEGQDNPDATAENDVVGAVPDATAQNANPDNAQVFGGAADQSNTDVDGSDVDGDGTADPGLSTGTGTAGAAATDLDTTAQTDADAMDDVQTPDNPTATLDGDAATDTDLAADGQTDDAIADLAAAHEGVAPMTDGENPGSQITHAILDIGGFLGLGQHSVAIPISDLTVYASGDELRVYLPWTREQLEALPAYDADDPATLGTSLWHRP